MYGAAVFRVILCLYPLPLFTPGCVRACYVSCMLQSTRVVYILDVQDQHFQD